MKKLVIISPNFTEMRFCERWIQFAKIYQEYNVYLFSPDNRKIGYQKEYSFGQVIIEHGQKFERENCHGRVFKINYHRFISWTSKDLIRQIKEISPNLIYYIGLHKQETIVQLLKGRNKFFKNAKVIVFSMRGPQHCLKNDRDPNIFKDVLKKLLFLYEKKKQKFIYTNCDAICCHYPEAKALFKEEGFNKPIYIQTQIGVNASVYRKNEDFRRKIRNKYHIAEDEFVFGCAVRFAKEKGVEVILGALEKVDARLLLMGSGNPKEEAEVDREIEEKRLKDKVIKTGFIMENNMERYWNAVDCAVHVPITTKNWVETFSLAVVQAMAVGIPIIGSSSGSVPYQIGYDELIVPENNSQALAEKMNWIMSNESDRNNYAKKVYERTIKKFDIHSLNKEMYNICEKTLQEG